MDASGWAGLLLWPVIGPGSGWLMMTRGTWWALLLLLMDSVELRIAMASAAGLAAGWLTSRERAGPSEHQNRVRGATKNLGAEQEVPVSEGRLVSPDGLIL